METNRRRGPEPGDTDAWLRLLQEKSLKELFIADVVAAVQKIGPNGNRRLVEGLMSHISDCIMHRLRKRIGRHFRNEGNDMIQNTHCQLIASVLKPRSADGVALRKSFWARVDSRAADAIRAETKALKREIYSEDEPQSAEPDSSSGSNPLEDEVHAESVLMTVTDVRKRLAFRLHMDDVPYQSKKTDSIAKALGVSAKTIEKWIGEVKQQLSDILGDQS